MGTTRWGAGCAPARPSVGLEDWRDCSPRPKACRDGREHGDANHGRWYDCEDRHRGQTKRLARTAGETLERNAESDSEARAGESRDRKGCHKAGGDLQRSCAERAGKGGELPCVGHG